MGKPPIYLILRGGLGNQLFMFATAYALANQSDRKLQLITHWFKTEQREQAYSAHTRDFELGKVPEAANYRNHLTRFLDYFIYGLFLASIRFPIISRFGIVTDGDQLKPSNQSRIGLVLYGYMQNPNTFNRYRHEIQKILIPRKSNQQKTYKEIESRTKLGQRTIAMHIRRGDYLLSPSAKNLLSIKYYENCLERLGWNQSQVYVFSDDIHWCKKNFNSQNFIFIDEIDPLRSLQLMSACDDFIVSPSTFSWWGAWLSESRDKRVVFPTPYNEESDLIWTDLPQPDWLPEKAIFQ
jgi:hypothetical protein